MEKRELKHAPGVSGNGTYLSKHRKAGIYARTVSMLQRKYAQNRRILYRRTAARALSKIIMTALLAVVVVLPMCLFDMFINFVMGW